MSENRSTSDVDIRLLPAEEAVQLDIANYAFEASPANAPQDREQYLPYLRGSRLPHAFDATGTPVARLAIYPQRMNVRGKILASGGIGGVASLPAGRRSGMVRALMRHSFDLMHEEGQPVSALYPFRPSFYQRLGYAGWIRPQWAVIDPAHLEPVLKAGVSGTTTWGRIADKWDEWCAFLAKVQRETHGFTISDKPRGDVPQFRNDLWVVLVHEGDEVTGGMTYQVTGYGGKMIVPSFYPLTVNARYTLLEWVARHVDQTSEAHIQVLPGSWPELWLHDVEAPTTSRDDASWAAPMGRIVSVDGLTGIGAGGGSVALELIDDACPWNNGTWTFHGTGEILEVAPGGEAQATLAIQALASLVFNGAGPGSEPESFRYRGWGNADAVADALRDMFPPARPFIHDRF